MVPSNPGFPAKSAVKVEEYNGANVLLKNTKSNQWYSVDAGRVTRLTSYDKHNWLKPQTTTNWLKTSQRLLID